MVPNGESGYFQLGKDHASGSSLEHIFTQGQYLRYIFHTIVMMTTATIADDKEETICHIEATRDAQASRRLG